MIFDQDGLLFNTEALWQEALLSAAAEAGHAIPAEVFNGSIGVRMTVMAPDLLEPTDEVRALCVLVARDLHHVRDLVSACP